MTRSIVAALLSLSLLSALPASAQTGDGSLRGYIKDEQGGVLPGVTVTVRNDETGVAQDIVTDGNGRYRVLYLNPGSYSVSAELQGFKKVVRPGNQVRVGDVLRVDLTMTPGGIEEKT